MASGRCGLLSLLVRHVSFRANTRDQPETSVLGHLPPPAPSLHLYVCDQTKPFIYIEPLFDILCPSPCISHFPSGSYNNCKVLPLPIVQNEISQLGCAPLSSWFEGADARVQDRLLCCPGSRVPRWRTTSRHPLYASIHPSIVFRMSSGFLD